MIYNGLMDIAENFDLFLFDAYGVFWEGNGFYPNSREVMAELVQQGKTVVIISNTTQLHDDIVKSYIKRGLLPDRDYNYISTSGDLLRKNLRAQNISFNSCPHPHKYYVIGLPHEKAFADTGYEQVNTPEEADFVYCGVPFMFPNDVQKYPQYASEYWPICLDENGNVERWDTLTPAPFVETVQKVAALKLPALNANPDFTAKEGHKLVQNSEAVFVVRNGSIAQMLRKAGTEVLEYGKPHANIYDFVFSNLQNEGIKIDKTRTCMIGDTVRTDAKGAVNVGIAPILCVSTGVTAEEINKGNSLENLCKAENIALQQIIQINSVGGK